MKNLWRLLFVALSLFLIAQYSVANTHSKKTYTKKHTAKVRHDNKLAEDTTPFAHAFNLQKIVADMNRRATAGVIVKSLKTGKILYQSDANQFFAPASNMKVITAFAALKYLGPNFTFQTKIMTDAPSITPSNGVLEGNLYVKYDGDPTFQLNDLNDLYKTLKQDGITTISGHLVVDTSKYDSDGVSPGTEDSDRSYCYGAPVNAAIFNKNCISFKLYPTRVGAPARLAFPYNIVCPVNNDVVTKSTGKCHLALVPDGKGGFTLDGCVSAQRGPVAITMPLAQAGKYAEEAAAKLLTANNIRVLGNSYPIQSESHLKLIAANQSVPLSKIVYQMMKKSDNLIANTLFKTIGATYNQHAATWQNSAAAVKAILQKNGIDTNGMVIVDGSGLSRDDRVTPNQLLQVLTAAYQDKNIANVYIQALPVGGLNGTLKNRLGAKGIIGKVKAKTGSMHGVSSLSGYIETQNGEMLAFSIVVNDFVGGLYPYRVMEDKICRVLHANY